jgi:hypothetical protein
MSQGTCCSPAVHSRRARHRSSRAGPEIEIEFEFRARDLFAEVIGTRRADELHWGPGPEHHPGLT